jgi:hypothetical protein
MLVGLQRMHDNGGITLDDISASLASQALTQMMLIVRQLAVPLLP